MTRAILISIQPQWVQKIFSGKKTIEIRKTMPKCKLPIDVYIYCTKNLPRVARGWSCCEGKLSPINLANGKVVAKFTLNKVEKINCCAVPYRKTNNLGYEYFNDDGVYQLKDDTGLVFERGDNYIDSMLKNKDFEKMQLKPIDIYNYLGDYGKFYVWHIDNLVKFDEYKELNEFKHEKPSICGVKDGNGLYQCKKCKYGDSYNCECNIKITKAPQSWCYVEGIE